VLNPPGHKLTGRARPKEIWEESYDWPMSEALPSLKTREKEEWARAQTLGKGSEKEKVLKHTPEGGVDPLTGKKGRIKTRKTRVLVQEKKAAGQGLEIPSRYGGNKDHKKVTLFLESGI